MEPPRKRRNTSIESLHMEDITAGKLSRSCDHCRLKKVKCDGNKPCSFCQKNDISHCNYSLMKKPGLKPGYGKGMNQRMDTLEDDITLLKQELLDLKKRVEYVDSGRPSGSYIETVDSSAGSSSSTSGSTVTSNGTNSSRSIQIPTLLNPQGGSSSFGLPSTNQCLFLIELFFLKIVPIFPLIHPSNAKDLELSFQRMNEGVEPPLVVYAIVLITLKFLNNNQMSDSDKKLYYEKCKEKIISTALKKINLDSLQSLILLAYDSLGGSVKVPEAWNYVSIASDYANYLKLGNENAIKLSMLTADSPSSINSSVHSNDTVARKKIKTVATKSLNLLKKPKTWVDEESRRHCFWCIFILDKLYAISSSHDMKLSPKKVSCLLPLKLSFWINQTPNVNANQTKTLKQIDLLSLSSSPHNQEIVSPTNSNTTFVSQQSDIYDSFAYYIELNKLMGDFHEFLTENVDITDANDCQAWKHSFNQMDSKLHLWFKSIPVKYRLFLETGEIDNLSISDIMFWVYYYTTKIKLHSGFGYPQSESQFFKASIHSRQVCIDSAVKVYEFVNNLKDDKVMESLGPHFGFHIWVNARVLFIDAVYQPNNENIALFQTILSGFSDVLYKIGKTWESSMVYYNILKFLNVNDLSYVNNLYFSQNNSDKEQDDDDEISSDNREPAIVISDVRNGSHSLLFWFSKLAEQQRNFHGNNEENTKTPLMDLSNLNGNGSLTRSLFNTTSTQLANFQTNNVQSFDEFQLTHDDFFNFLALDVNGSGSFQ